MTNDAEHRGPFRIQAVAELTGVPAPTLRAWERRYGVPTPSRTASAYRLYSARDVELVRAMRELCDKGMAAAEAAKVVLEAKRDEPEELERTDVYSEARSHVLDAVRAFDPAGIDLAVLRAAMLGDLPTLYERVLSPVVVEIGQMWHTKTLTVAQEHLATERLLSLVCGYLRLLPAVGRPPVLLASFADEQHTLGLYGAAIQFASWGYRPVVLGARTPPSAVHEAVSVLQPALVGLSVIMPPEGSLLNEYRDACGDAPWVIGGAAAETIASRVKRLGGHVALGPASQWSKEARLWLKGAT